MSVLLLKLIWAILAFLAYHLAHPIVLPAHALKFCTTMSPSPQWSIHPCTKPPIVVSQWIKAVLWKEKGCKKHAFGVAIIQIWKTHVSSTWPPEIKSIPKNLFPPFTGDFHVPLKKRSKGGVTKLHIFFWVKLNCSLIPHANSKLWLLFVPLLDF